MKTFEIRFIGRKCGALGIFHDITTQVFANDPEAAKLALYDRFEHIQHPTIKEVQSPFDAETLVNRIQNTQEEHRLIRLRVEGLRDTLDAVARRQAKANADWHDDPESNDHGLFHAPSEQQFPREMRDAAILELVSRHLEVLNENETAAKERTR